MIVSASRRTDIPALYEPWFFHRLSEGFVWVRNPFNPHQVSRIPLSPDEVDAFVFWTKNAAPMLAQLDALRPYPFYFQFTLTSYGPDVEPGLPSKRTVILPAFLRLSRLIGPERVIWRYDPILFSSRYTPDFHARSFAALAKALQGSTYRCVFSFFKPYRKAERNVQPLRLLSMDEKTMRNLVRSMAQTAHAYGMQLEACAQPMDLTAYGVGRAHCIDAQLLERLCGMPLKTKKDTGQRPLCGCAASVDIGAYNTCINGCLYCYANANPQTVMTRFHAHDSASPLLCSTLSPYDTIAETKAASVRVSQTRLKPD